MLIFALDSTAIAGSVAICQDETPLASFHIKNQNTHSETLLPMAESLFRVLSLTPDDIDVFAVSNGPGSFTGVRIGVATVKGLAFGKGKPCVAVSTLEALAENLMPAKGILCPVMNARRGQVYNAIFLAKDGKLERVTRDRALSARDLILELSDFEEPIFLCGDGSDLMNETAKELQENGAKIPIFAPVASILADENAISVAKCAYRVAIAGNTVSDAELAPTYLRMPQAERERLERLGASK